MDQQVFRLGKLFCGPGGLACGAMHAKSSDGRFSITHAWANDYDADTCETYRKNICPEAPETVHCGDVRELDIRKKIGAPSGGYVTKQMLELYGRTYVTFRKYADGTYLLDF